ncbi:MAG: TolC family protein [Bacteroidetes bacterium]|nr:TolC family protein [Bacteroidota bacterium]MBS1630074.1 TolC family protein [Bacteroidota bacterium]
MSFIKHYLLILLVFALAVPLKAQEFLSLDSALARALAYNYDLQIVGLNKQVAQTNHALGAAGLLPQINGSAGINSSIANSKIERSDGVLMESNGAQTLSYEAGINASFTVFAAGRAFLLYRQLGKQVSFADASFRAQIQSTLSAVIQAYASVVNNQQQAVALDTAISLAKARMDLSKAKYDIGTSAKVDYLQARVDYNAARSQRLSQDAGHSAALAQLNELMGADAAHIYQVADSLPIQLNLRPADSSLLAAKSPLLEAQRINIEMARLNQRIARSNYFPSLDATAGYNYSSTLSGAGLLKSNRSIGPGVGLSLNVPLFQAGSMRRNEKLASLSELNAELEYARQERAIARQYRTAWTAYQNAVAAFNLEQENLGYARENLDIQQARFRVGVATSIELREAENSYTASLARYFNAAYQAKVAETQVLETEASLQ